MVVSSISQVARSSQFRQYLVQTLMNLCKVDTAINPDVAFMAKGEKQALQQIEREIAEMKLPAARTQYLPINPAIAQHPFYSQTYYTITPQNPKGLDVKTTYLGRQNMVVIVPGDGKKSGGQSLAMNAHVDVVRPYIPPRLEGNTIFGRGACDDKGPVVAMVGALKLVADYLAQQKQTLNRDLVAMFVIEEEMGGNGSLSAAIDRDLKKHYDSIMIMECASSRIYPGNRGCVWYKVEGRIPGVNLFEASAFIVEEMEKEGRAIKAESRHDLFPHRPCQTCHGILGHSGEHPSRINGLIEFDIEFDNLKPAGQAKVKELVRDIIEFAMTEYIGLYGDKTKVLDSQTNKPKVDHHYDLIEKNNGFTVKVHGSTGHMGSILLNDGSITKAATMVRTLVLSRAQLQNLAGAKVSMNHVGWSEPSHLLMEGGQGFLPTHQMKDIQERLRQAVHRGARRYLNLMGKNDLSETALVISYDKLHNAAFAGSPDSPTMRNAIAAAKAVDMWKEGQPIVGWDVSCDARIFACEYPDLTVLTSGPGHLIHAHADYEQLNVDELVQFTEFLAYFILRQTGTVAAS